MPAVNLMGQITWTYQQELISRYVYGDAVAAAANAVAAADDDDDDDNDDDDGDLKNHIEREINIWKLR